MITVVVIILAVLIMVLLGANVAFAAKINELDFRIGDLEHRIEQVAEAGKVLHREICEIDSRGRMRDRIEATKAELSGHSHVTQEQVDDAIKRAKL